MKVEIRRQARVYVNVVRVLPIAHGALQKTPVLGRDFRRPVWIVGAILDSIRQQRLRADDPLPGGKLACSPSNTRYTKRVRNLFRIFALASWSLLAGLSNLCGAIPLSLTIDPLCGLPRVGIAGQVGESFLVEGSDDLSGALPWTPLVQFTVAPDLNSWCDSEARWLTRKFYRAIRFDAPPPTLRPRNFRLIDQMGKARELYYSFNDAKVKGIALLFTGESCAAIKPYLPVINSLSNQFGGQGVKLWIVASPFGTDRSALVAEAKTLGLTLPLLHDSAQAVVREFGITRVPEAVLLKNGSFEVVYRGAIEESTGVERHAYLADALASLLASRTPNPAQVRPLGTEPALHQEPIPDYSTDIAPLLKQRCVSCHSPGNIAPWSMNGHGVVQQYGDLIKDEILSQRMPPWHADPTVGKFSNDGSLRPEEASRLIRWIDAGSPRGEGDDLLTEILEEPPVWPLGEPDLVLSIPRQSLPATGDIDYRELPVNPGLSEDKWLRAAVVRPGNRAVVHHSLVFLGSSDAALDGLAGYFAGYVPGLDPDWFPEGTAKLLPKNTSLTFQMHYISIGTPQTDQTQLGLYFSPKPPAQRLQTKAAFNILFRIPAGASDHQTTVRSTPFTKTSWLYEVSPHQHLRGKWFNYELELANGQRTPLIQIPNYVFNWQRLYRFEKPIQLPVGSRIVCTGAWDNSPQNLANPNPKVAVSFGRQTYEEMFIGYFNYGEPP